MVTRFNASYRHIIVSSIALIIVLIIQVNWIVETARIKEQLFNEKANMILSKTISDLSSDSDACGSLEQGKQAKATAKIDSLFGYYMNLYRIKIDYVYELKPNFVLTSNNGEMTSQLLPTQQRCYRQNIAGLTNMELKLIFPDKIQYVVAEMGLTFVSSVLLILIVLFLSWQSVYSLMKEKRIAEQTTDFISNMTHELKTPLTNIGLAGKMLIRDNNISSPEKVRHYSAIMLKENEKLNVQIEQVLGVSALEHGEMPMQKQPVDLHVKIEELLQTTALQLDDKKIKLTQLMTAQNAVVIGDSVHLQNALSNLLDNAIKYSAGLPQIQIKTWNKEDRFYFSISNNGSFIEKKYYKKIFEKFFRVPTGNIHNVKGFGVGLAYVKRIVDLHQGSIQVESSRDAGTVFTLSFTNG